MKYTIGIDLGTSSLKGIILDQTGKVLGSASSEYEVNIPKTGYSEQEPNDWIISFDTVMDDLFKNFPEIKDNVDGISFAGQMHSLVMLDTEDNVIRPAILWNDVRTSKQSNMINDENFDEVVSITKNRSLEGFTLPKLLWIKENESDNFKRLDTVLLPKDYLRFVITGEKHMDLSDAAGTLLLDIEKGVWSNELCDKYGVKVDTLPTLIESSGFTGKLSGKYLDKYGEINVYAGGADNACAALGAGIVDSKRSMVSIGTSGVFLSAEDSIKNYEGLLHFFNHSYKDYYSMGVTLSAGSSLSWIRKVLDSEKSYDELLENIADIPIGSDGLIFTPYLMGERTPHFDATARGSFVGLDALHSKDHLLRSVIEGITFSLKNSFDIINDTREDKVKEIISVGGGAKNNDWLQIQADIFNTPVRTLTVEEGPALGAAMLAAIGSEWFETIEDCVNTCVGMNDLIYPIESNVKEYEEYYEIYNKVYSSLKEVNKMINKKRTT